MRQKEMWVFRFQKTRSTFQKKKQKNPILQIVAIPVQDNDSTPCPKYSMIIPVPPETLNMPANFKMTSLGEAHPLSCPFNFTPQILGAFSSQGIPAIASTASA